MTSATSKAQGVVSGSVAPAPLVAETNEVRLRLHARVLRGSRSLREAAALVGVSHEELGRIERGGTLIRFETLAKSLSAYHCTLGDLMEVEQVPVV